MVRAERDVRLVVGVDGSECGWAALDWATGEAAARNTRLTVACVVPDWPTHPPGHADLSTAGERAARATVDTAARRVREAAPQVAFDTRVVNGPPAACLVELATGADLLVVGSRGYGGFAALLLGSTAESAAAHASCPVVVVRGAPAAAGPVVVGVDGSPVGTRALRHAFAHAAAHRLGVRACHAYRAFVPGIGPYPGVPVDADMVREEAGQFAREEARRCVAEFPEVPLEVVVDPGSPARRLVEESRAASLLVVGSRGHGGFAGLLLGSVGQAVIRHAHCPVAVVH